MKQILSILIAYFIATTAFASSNGVYEKAANMGIDETFESVYQELEQRNFYVIFEANIGKKFLALKKNGLKTTIGIS